MHTHNVADIEDCGLFRYVLILYGFVFYYDPEYIKKPFTPSVVYLNVIQIPFPRKYTYNKREREVGIQEYKLMVH